MTDKEKASPDSPEVFISYSWDDPAHEAWVLQLATRLWDVHVNIVLDRWDTTLGSDMAVFMEKAASLDKRVLAVVSDTYREKSNAPAGGVGYEKRVIAPTVMKDLASDRIIPILRNNNERKLPHYMGAAKYIDFTEDTQFEERLFELASELRGRPILARPERGPDPFAGDQTEAQIRAEMRLRSSRYTSTDMSGSASFDYSNNNGRYTFGSGDHAFTLDVSGAGRNAVHVYSDPDDVKTVALKTGAVEFSSIGDGTDYDASSRSRTPRVGDAIILQNRNGFWAAVLVDDVQSRDLSPAPADSLSFRFHILSFKGADFSAVAPA